MCVFVVGRFVARSIDMDRDLTAGILEEAKKAGLKTEKKHEHLFPSKEIPIVSVNRLICE